jgi:alpha-tubulin suppressor-like RCC1 family protein
VVMATYALTEPLGAGALAAGAEHTVLATPQGLLYAWGRNSFGQIGDGSTTMRSAPTAIPSVTGVISLAAGDSHTLALTWDGRVFAWGYNNSGRLGDGTTNNQSSPVLVSSLSDVVAIAAGASHSLALTANGSVYAWGVGTSGQLGQGSTASLPVPTLVPGLTGIVGIAAGEWHSLALTTTGHVYAWGANGSGQLGDGTIQPKTSPVLVSGLTQVAAVRAGGTHNLARLHNGNVYAWGGGSQGQLGLGGGSNVTTPTLMGGFTALDLDAGDVHSLAITNDGALWVWGDNANGKLGDGTTTDKMSPLGLVSPASIAFIAGGDNHSVAATTDGHVWSWGANTYGQLGDGTTTPQLTPHEVVTIAGTWGATPAPTLSLAPGTYDSPQAVTVTAGAGVTVRYTTNGSAPTEVDPILGPEEIVAIDRTMTLSVRGWSAARAPSAVVVANYQLQPPAPTANVPAGVYNTAQTVSLQSVPDTEVRYTLDGSVPSETSPLYTAALTISQTVTLRARAFRTNWTPSDVLVAAYQIVGSLDAPTASPPAGTYESAQHVELQAASGTTIHYTTDGSEPTTSAPTYTTPVYVAASLTLRAKAYQSGFASPELMASYVIETSDFDPVEIVSRQSPQSMYITPDIMTLRVGEFRRLTLVTATGEHVTDASWQVSQESVAVIDYDGVGTADQPADAVGVRGVAPGQAIVTAEGPLGTVRAVVKVVAGGTFAAGTELWSVYPETVNNWLMSAVQGQPNRPGDPYMYFNESLASGDTAIRAVDEQGAQIWRTVLPGFGNKIVGTDDGGVLVEAGNQIIKLSGNGTTRWVYTEGHVSAVGPDAVYVGVNTNEIRVLDEATGTLRYTVPLNDVSTLTVRGNPSSPFYVPEDCAPFAGMPPLQFPANYPTSIVVATNGNAYLAVQMKAESFVSDTTCASSSQLLPQGWLTTSLDTYLIELQPDAPGPRTLLAHDEGEVYVQDIDALPGEYVWRVHDFYSADGRVPQRNLYAFAPDGAGGILLTMTVASDLRTEWEQTLTMRVVDGAVAYVVSTPDGRLSNGIAILESGSALFTQRSPSYGYGYVTAVDQETGLLQWSIDGDLLSTTQDGGAIIQAVSEPNYDHTSIIRIDDQGMSTSEVVELPDFLLDDKAQYLDDGTILVQDASTSAYSARALPGFTAQQGTTAATARIDVRNANWAKSVSTKEEREHVPSLGITEGEGETGYDKKQRALMVPIDDANRIRVKAPKNVPITLVADSASGLILSPSAIPADGTEHIVTVTGGGTWKGTTRVDAQDSSGRLLGRAFYADVKPLLTKHIRTWQVHDQERMLAPTSAPSAAQIQGELNRIFERQANIHFTVEDMSVFANHYDTKQPPDGKLQLPVDSKGQICQICQPDSEYNVLKSAFVNAQSGNPWWEDPDSLMALFVNVFTESKIGGISRAIDHKTPMFIRTEWPSGPPPAGIPNPTQHNAISLGHEVGHVLGRGGTFAMDSMGAPGMVITPASHTGGDSTLMGKETVFGDVKRRLTREDWNVVNRVNGSPFSGKNQAGKSIVYPPN